MDRLDAFTEDLNKVSTVAITTAGERGYSGDAAIAYARAIMNMLTARRFSSRVS